MAFWGKYMIIRSKSPAGVGRARSRKLCKIMGALARNPPYSESLLGAPPGRIRMFWAPYWVPPICGDYRRNAMSKGGSPGKITGSLMGTALVKAVPS